jgi:hypothetical protein
MTRQISVSKPTGTSTAQPHPLRANPHWEDSADVEK